MLAALRGNKNRKAVSSVHSIPAPTGGLNARDPLASMSNKDAIVLDNFFPEVNYVSLRRGHASHATGMSTAVQSLMTYHALNGSEKMFAAANGAIYDVTTAGAGSSVYSTSITSNKWQWVNFSTSGGLFIVAVNGADTPLKYDGSTWTTDSLTGSISSSADLINVFSHNERLWFVEKNTLNLWYLASNAVTGALTKFPLGGVFNNGGQVVAGSTLSVDTGVGIKNLIVFVTDNGEAAIYSGTNPASDFLLLGVFPIGLPIGNRCLFKIAGDLVVLTTFGAESMKQVMVADRADDDRRTITSKIRETFNVQARNYKANFGWQGIVYPKGRFALINVPVAEGASQVQFVQNINSGEWCRFTSMNANCWGILNDELYFGGNSDVVYKADTGYQDNGGQIQGEIKTAFDPCKSPGRNKLFNLLRPLLVTNGTAELTAGVNVDYNNTIPTGTLSASAGDTGLWGTGLWGTSQWGGAGLLIRKWLTVGQIGTTVAARLRVAGNGISVQVNGFDINYQPAEGTVL